jgi:UDP-N-acetylenolpyruvoylglucosamine reductase
MSGIFFSGTPTKVSVARMNVKAYVKNREEFIKRIIKITTDEVVKKINEISLGMGKSQLKLEIEKFIKSSDIIKSEEEKFKLKDFAINKTEKDLVVQAVALSLQDEGFKTDIKPACLEISWEEEQPQVVQA